MTQLTFMVQPDGMLPPGIRNSLKHIVPSFAGKKVQLSIGEAKEKRSISQNAYLYGVIEPHVRAVRAENGDPVSMKQIHEELLAEFAPQVQSRKLDGTMHARPMRSHEMSVEQMNDYITAITAAMANFGNPVPMRGL